MTSPVEREKFAGNTGLEHGGLERDELLKLCNQLTQLLFFLLLLIHVNILLLKVHVLYALCFNWLHLLWFFSGIKEAVTCST